MFCFIHTCPQPTGRVAWWRTWHLSISTHSWLNPQCHVKAGRACEFAGLYIGAQTVSLIRLIFFKKKCNLYSVFRATSWPIGGLNVAALQLEWHHGAGRAGMGCLECGWNVRGPKCRLSKQAGISIKDRLFGLSLKGKMEKEKQVLTSWQACLSLPPSASYLLSLIQSVSFVSVKEKVSSALFECCAANIHLRPAGTVWHAGGFYLLWLHLHLLLLLLLFRILFLYLQ